MTNIKWRKLIDYLLGAGMCIIGLATIVLGSIFLNFGTSGNSEQISLVTAGVGIIFLAFFFPLRSKKRYMLSSVAILSMTIYFSFQSSDIPPMLIAILGAVSILYFIRNKVIRI